MTIRPCALLLALALAPALARAQKTPVPVGDAPPPPEFAPPHVIGFGGVGLDLALPTGVFKNYVAVGGGFDGFFALKLVPSGALSVRADLTVLLYGSETRRVPLGSGPLQLITVDVTTSNTIFGMSIGPQLVATSGRLRPYAMGGIGFSYFNTSSSVAGSDNSNQPFASSNNFGDGTFAIRAGGGLWIQVGHGRTPVWIDLGAQYLWNGKVSYLRPGSIDLGPPVVYHPIRSETHLWMIHAGIAAAITPKGS
jgi:opacity protein-like surface antigen